MAFKIVVLLVLIAVAIEGYKSRDNNESGTGPVNENGDQDATTEGGGGPESTDSGVGDNSQGTYTTQQGDCTCTCQSSPPTPTAVEDKHKGVAKHLHHAKHYVAHHLRSNHQAKEKSFGNHAKHGEGKAHHARQHEHN